MLKIDVKELGIYFVNCYLIHEENSKSCVAIDPGGNSDKVMKFLAICEELGYPPQHGQFGADMKVASENDGPVTLILDTDQLMDTPRHK